MKTSAILLVLIALSLAGCAGSSPGVDASVTTGTGGSDVSIGVGATGDSTEAVITIETGDRP